MCGGSTNSIGDSGATCLSDSLKTLAFLKTLDLAYAIMPLLILLVWSASDACRSNNRMHDAGATSIATSLVYLADIRFLDLS